VIAALVLAAGCSSGRSDLGQVDGVVRVDGQPLTSGKIVFQDPTGQNALGAIGPDGRFTLRTGQTASDPGVPGARIGLNKVAIVAYKGAAAGRPDPTAPRKPMEPAVPQKYLATGTSGLTYEVKPGENHPEFDIQSGE
jgi:hypothetical protein